MRTTGLPSASAAAHRRRHSCSGQHCRIPADTCVSGGFMHVRRSSGFLIPLRPFRRLRHPSRHRKRQCRHHWSTRVSSPSANAMGMASKPSRCDWPSTPPQRQSAATTPLRPTSYNSGGCRPAQTPPRAARAPAPGPAGLQAITGANKRTPDGPAHTHPRQVAATEHLGHVVAGHGQQRRLLQCFDGAACEGSPACCPALVRNVDARLSLRFAPRPRAARCPPCPWMVPSPELR